ncbi:unnamed protein product [Amoebophrya sp. A120]|nr:unnamed protein product [Amoebophrya sp. A120]|eukprot:GSA120T00008580001.1
MANLNTSKWLSGMNCTGVSAQDNQKLQSQKVQRKETVRDFRLKTFWKNKIDESNNNERREKLHVNNHGDTLEATRAFHVNRNSMHTWRHTTARNFRDTAYRQKQERFEAQAMKKAAQTDSFIQRRTRLLVEMAGDERAKREIALRDCRAATMTDLNAYRAANLKYCGNPKW